MKKDNTYRSDIQQLRGIAVLLVVFQHAGILFPGGFIGVDIYFVISGYLITESLQNIHQNQIPLVSFYKKRFYRIFPPLIFMVLFTLFLGSLVLSPSDLIDLSYSSLSAISLVSNFYFFKTSGYFASPSETKPLLHTWSLGIEEQFYLFYPLVFIWLLKNSAKKSYLILILLMTMSFCFWCTQPKGFLTTHFISLIQEIGN